MTRATNQTPPPVTLGIHQPCTVTVDMTYRVTMPARWKTDGPVSPLVDIATGLADIITDSLEITAQDARSMDYPEPWTLLPWQSSGDANPAPLSVAVRCVRVAEIPAPPEVWSPAETFTPLELATGERVRHPEPCGDCGRAIDYDYSDEQYHHADDPWLGCWMIPAEDVEPNDAREARRTGPGWDGQVDA